MTDRSFKIYQGEDLSPVTDLTAEDANAMGVHIRWEEAEFGTRAFRGESTNSNVPIVDPNGVTGNELSLPSGFSRVSLASKNVLELVHGSNVMWRGRMATKDYSRGDQMVNRYREAGTYLEDINIDLRGIVVHNWARPAETDAARLQSLIATYLSGTPRRTTIINGSNLVNAGSNTVWLPAHTYTQSSTAEVIEQVAQAAGKTYHLLPRRRTTDAHTAELFYDGNDAILEQCPYRITDRPEEVKASPGHYFFPIWNVGPASTENGQELISGVWLFYGQESYVHVSDATQANLYSHWEEVIYDGDIETEAEATARAQAVLYARKYEERTYNVTIGPLTDGQVGSIRAGQHINIKARGIPDADDAFANRKIAQLKLTTPAPGMWFAHLQLERPLRAGAHGSGTPITGPGLGRDIECLTFPSVVPGGWGDDWTLETPGSSERFYTLNNEAVIEVGGDGGFDNGNITRTGPYSLPYEAEVKFRWTDTGGFFQIEDNDPGTEVEILAYGITNTLGSSGANSAARVNVALDPDEPSPGNMTLKVRLRERDQSAGTLVLTRDFSTADREGDPAILKFRVETGAVKAKFWFADETEPDWEEIAATLSGTFGTLRLSTHTFNTFDDGVNTYLRISSICDNFFRETPITGGPDATAGDSDDAAPADHDHDSVDNGDAAGGELGGTYPNPTVDSTHAGSNHNQPVRKNSTGSVFERRRLNFIEGSNVTLTVADDAGSDEVDITIASTGGGSASITVQDEGTPLATGADTLNFVGSGVTATGSGTTKTITIVAGSGEPFDPSNRTIIFDECYFVSTSTIYEGGISQAVSGGSTLAVSDVAGHPGQIGINTGTGTTGRAALTASAGSTVIGAGAVEFGCVAALDNLSDGTNTYTARMGQQDGSGATPNRGVFFRYTDSVNGGRWEGVARDAGVETGSVLDTGVTADTNYHRFAYIINAAGTSVEFFIDGASVGTVSANLPTTAVTFVPGAIVKSAGGSSRTLRLDAYWYIIDFTTAR